MLIPKLLQGDQIQKLSPEKTKRFTQRMREIGNITPYQKTYEKAMETQEVKNEKEKVLSVLMTTDEYEQTLQEFDQVIKVAEDILNVKSNVKNIAHLREEIARHKKFFTNLNNSRVFDDQMWTLNCVTNNVRNRGI